MQESQRNEKEEKNEKGEGESWDEKWRRDPVDAAGWALILIWAGIVLLANSMNWFSFDGAFWPWIFLGAGVIMLLSVVVRLVVPAYRRPIIGGLILGAVFLGIGLTQLPGLEDRWPVILAVVLIIVGAGAILRGVFVKRE